MGGGGKSSKNESAEVLAEIAQDLYNDTGGLRDSLIGRSEAFLGIPSVQYGTPTTVSAPQPQQQQSVADLKNSGFRQQPQNNVQTIQQPVQTFTPEPYSPSSSPVYDPTVNALEDQFAAARQNIISNTARGGARQQLLADLETDKASQRSAVVGGLAQQELDRATSLAFGQPLTTSTSGIASAANTQGAIASANAQAAGQTKSGLGQGAGFVLGSKVGGK